MSKMITSDLHFAHQRIVEYTTRPQEFLEDIDGHNTWLINQLNSSIDDKDEVYHLGDFAFSKNIELISGILSKLKGTWKFILGNHDVHKSTEDYDGADALYDAIVLCNEKNGTSHKLLGHYHEFSYRKKHIVLFHFPIESWHKKSYGAIHLHGHCHGGLSKAREGNKMDNRIDCGIDNHPQHLAFSLDDIIDGKHKNLEF